MNSCFFLSMRRQTNHGPISQHSPRFTVYTVMWNICRLPIPPTPRLPNPSPKRRLFYRHEKLIELECVHMKEKEEEKRGEKSL